MTEPAKNDAYWAGIVKEHLPKKEVFLLTGAINLIQGISFAIFGYYTLQSHAYRWTTCGALLGICTSLHPIKTLAEGLRQPSPPEGMTVAKIKEAAAFYLNDVVNSCYSSSKITHQVKESMMGYVIGIVALFSGGCLAHQYGYLHAYFSKTSQFFGAALLVASLSRAVTYPIFKKLANDRSTA